MNYTFNKLLAIDPYLQITGVYVEGVSCIIKYKHSDMFKETHDHFSNRPVYIEPFSSKKDAQTCLVAMMELADKQEAKIL